MIVVDSSEDSDTTAKHEKKLVMFQVNALLNQHLLHAYTAHRITDHQHAPLSQMLLLINMKLYKHKIYQSACNHTSSDCKIIQYEM